VSRRPPNPREDIFGLYWYFASERQRIFARRVNGGSPPWTDDRILATYKFCNVFRAADRVSQFLIREVAYGDESCTPADLLFRIVACRTFSNIVTWRRLTELLGRQPVVHDIISGGLRKALDEIKSRTGRLYTGAFILCASNAYRQKWKHHNHVELFRDMFVRRKLPDRLLRAKAFEDVYDLLHSFPLMGDFMSYQTAIDLNYSSAINFSENDFTKPGPGAVRGLKKVFIDLGDYSPADVVKWMVDIQDREFERRGLTPATLWGRRLHAIDCQGLFCETDKYCREARPELTSSRSRIKARFSQTAEPLVLYFPPKWGINQSLPKHSVLGSDYTSSHEHHSEYSAWGRGRLPADAELTLGLQILDEVSEL
jgi:hypothetical protein